MQPSKMLLAAAIFTLGGCFVVLDDYDSYQKKPAVEPPPECPTVCYGDSTQDDTLAGIGACKWGQPVCEGSALVSCMGWGAPSLEVCNAGMGPDADENCDGKACEHVYRWSSRFGDTATAETFQSLAIGTDGSLALTGTFSGNLNVGGSVPGISGTNATFLAKYDPNGNPLWLREVKYSSNEPIRLRDVAVDGNNRVYIAGQFDFMGAGNVYGYLNTVDVNGTPSMSSFQFGGPIPNAGDIASIAIDANGTLYGTGTIVNMKTVPCSATVLMNQPSTPNMVVFHTQTTAGFQCIYGTYFPGGTHRPVDIAVGSGNSADKLVVAGTYEGALDMLPAAPAGRPNGFILQLDAATGNIKWQTAMTTPAAQSKIEVAHVTVDSTGLVYVTGTIYDLVTFDNQGVTADPDGDMFVAAYNPSDPIKPLVNLRLVNGLEAQKGMDIVAYGGKLFAAGTFRSEIQLTNAGEPAPKIAVDARGPFWMELDPKTLAVRWVHTLGVADPMENPMNPIDSVQLAPVRSVPASIGLAGTAKRTIKLSQDHPGATIDVFAGVLTPSP